MHKDTQLFSYLLAEAQKRYGRLAPQVLSMVVSKTDQIAHGLPGIVYDVDKAARAHDLACKYGRGFNMILDKAPPGKRPDFDWLAKHYGHAIQAGSDDTLEGLVYSSYPSDDVAVLVLSPRDMNYDSYVRMYRMASSMPCSNLTSELDISFAPDTRRMNNATMQNYVNIYIMIKKK